MSSDHHHHHHFAMDHDLIGEQISNERNSASDRDEDHHDAMEVDGGLPMIADSNIGDVQSHDLCPAASTPTPTPASREPPTFDEDTERPRQRRRFHVTVEDDADTETQAETSSVPTGTGADGAEQDDEVAVLESAPPRMSELSIAASTVATPSIGTEGEQAPMLGVVADTSTPSDHGAVSAEPTSPNPGADLPHTNSLPLPDAPSPQANPDPPHDTVTGAIRRLTSANANPDQMQADLALLAPYIAAQAMAAAFPAGGGRPPPAGGGNTGENPSTAGAAQRPAPGQNNNGGPLPPFPFGLPFLFGAGGGEPPADPKRAERLAGGLKVVEDGLLKRWKTICEDGGAVCAVCYSELLEEPGTEKENKDDEKEEEKDIAKEAREESEMEQGALDEDAHEQALRDMLKRRELMEKLETEEKERKLETAVLAFPCGHVFHRTCLLPWLSRHTTCPTCRFDIDPKSDTLNLPADEEMPFPLGANGLNFGDLFTVGPVLRVPRVPAPGRPIPRHTHDHHHTHEPREANARRRSDSTGGQDASENTDPPSISEIFDTLFGPLLQAAGIPPPPRRPGNMQPAEENSQSTTPASSADPTPAPPAMPSSAPTSPTSTTPTSTPPVSANPASNVQPSTIPYPTSPPNIAPYRRASEPHQANDRDRPVAMFGRHTHRRPPQPITPAWMRAARPAPDSTAATPVSAPEVPSTESAPSAIDSSTPAGSVPTPSTPAPAQTGEGSRPLDQFRAMVSNLIPRRLSNRRASGTLSVRSNRSTGSTTSTSMVRNVSQSTPGPTSPRTGGIRAMLQGSTSLLRDFTSGRRSSRASTSTMAMPDLESDSEHNSAYSEDEVESEYDDDMPPLEPIDGRESAASTSRRAADEPEDDEAPPPLEAIPGREPQGETGANAQPRPPSQDMLENVITLRIDLGHTDGRDETIIIPLLFNPNGRPGGPSQAGGTQPAPRQTPPPAPQRARTPPPQKKWTPPEPIKTFRQVVEEKEREIGWRCDDPACLLGPADDEEPSDEPHPIMPRYPIMRSIAPEGPVRHKSEDGIRVYADGEDVRVKGENPVCEHTLHAECLVTSARVNGWGPTQNAGPGSRVTLRCPMCRAEGTVDRQVWDAGVEAEAGESN